MQAVPGRHMVRSKHLATPQTRPTDLTADDVRALTGSVETFTGYWRIKATRAPGPDAGSGAARWAYLYRVGPPSEDVVPPLAITRHRTGFRVFILDPLELFASGRFETKDCSDLACALQVVLEIIDEARETALDRPSPDVVALATLLATRKPRENRKIRRSLPAATPADILVF